MTIPIALVEDNERLRRRFLDRFRFFAEIEVVFSAASGEAFLERLAELPADRLPHVVLMDIELPGLSGIQVTERLKAVHPDVEVMMCTVFEDEDKILESIRMGATGYLLKDMSVEAVVEAIRELLDGGSPMSPAIARKVLSQVHRTAPSGSADDTVSSGPKENRAEGKFSLTPREREILERIVQDEMEPAIADALHISPHTVRTHIKNIYTKLHVHSRASAVRVTLQRNLLG